MLGRQLRARLCNVVANNVAFAPGRCDRLVMATGDMAKSKEPRVGTEGTSAIRYKRMTFERKRRTPAWSGCSRVQRSPSLLRAADSAVRRGRRPRSATVTLPVVAGAVALSRRPPRRVPQPAPNRRSLSWTVASPSLPPSSQPLETNYSGGNPQARRDRGSGGRRHGGGRRRVRHGLLGRG
jgi:hypothetical protein